MVYHIEGGGGISQAVQAFHQPEDVFGVVEIPGAGVLDFHDDGMQVFQPVNLKDDVVGAGRKLGSLGHEQGGKVAALPEQVVQVTSPCGVPAVLGAEAPDLAVEQGLVQLIL